MKRFFYLAMLMVATVCLNSACSSDDPDYHTLRANALSATSYPVVYYADQTLDSIKISSTDSWTSNTDCNWIKYKKTNSKTTSGNAKYNYGTEYLFTEAIEITPNTTGDTRTTTIKFDANNRNIGLIISQMPHLDITEPAKTPVSPGSNKYEFVKSVKAGETSATISFNIHADVTLQSSVAWISVSPEVYHKDTKTVSITIEPNTTGIERQGNVVIKSATGATTAVVIKQAK